MTKCDEVWTKFGEVWTGMTKFGQIIANAKTIRVPMKIHPRDPCARNPWIYMAAMESWNPRNP